MEEELAERVTTPHWRARGRGEERRGFDGTWSMALYIMAETVQSPLILDRSIHIGLGHRVCDVFYIAWCIKHRIRSAGVKNVAYFTVFEVSDVYSKPFVRTFLY